MAHRFLLVSLLLFSFLAAPALAFSDKPEPPPAANVAPGSSAPDFTLKTLDGKSVSLSQLRGKVVFLNFWASWCPPCRAEMPAMERLNEVFSGGDFVMVAINVEQEKDPVQDFLSQHPHGFTVLLDPQAKAQNLYQVYRFPETFIIDKQGKVVRHFIGGREWSEVEFLKWVDRLVKE